MSNLFEKITFFCESKGYKIMFRLMLIFSYNFLDTKVILTMFSPFKVSKLFKYLNYSKLRGQYNIRNLSKVKIFKLSIVKPNIILARKIVSMKKISRGKEISGTLVEENKTFMRILWDTLFSLVRIILIIFITIQLLTLYYVNPRSYPRVLVRALEFLGPTFIKLGQWASTRRDLFSEELCDTLSHLQRNASSHSWTYTKCLLSSTFGREWKSLFPEIDKTPIGSGCCAQVYKAWMNKEESGIQINKNFHIPIYIHVLEALRMGFIMDYFSTNFPEKNAVSEKSKISLQPIVIKVVHPAVENYVETDLFMIEILSMMISFLIPSLAWLDLTGCIKEFSRMMKSQLDMSLEARNLHKFAFNFSKNDSITFPEPIMNLTTSQILVESFHEGKYISDYLNSSDQKLKSQLVKMAIPMVLKMVFEDNFVHCDLHPGNILVQENNTQLKENEIISRRIMSFASNKQLRLVILDCGLVSSLNDRCLQNLRNVLLSIALGDGALAGEYIMSHSSHMTHDPMGFKTAIKNIVEKHMKSRFNLKKVNFSEIMKEFYSTIIHYHVRQDSAFINIILSMLVIEGLGRYLDPNNDILQEIILFLR